MRNYFRDDPYWTTAKFNSKCAGCKTAIARRERIFYYPKGKTVFCAQCGRDEYERFRELAEAEYMESGPCDYDGNQY